MNSQRPGLETAAVITLVLLIGYAVADLGILLFPRNPIADRAADYSPRIFNESQLG
jgi:hypothetical protein